MQVQCSENDSFLQVFHTRGLTLSMEYHNVRTVVRNRGSAFFDLRPEVVHIPGRSHCEVCLLQISVEHTILSSTAS